MDERDQLPADDAVSDDTVEGSDTELDEIAADLDTVEAAMKAYLDWETALVEQIERDGDARFREFR